MNRQNKMRLQEKKAVREANYPGNFKVPSNGGKVGQNRMKSPAPHSQSSATDTLIRVRGGVDRPFLFLVICLVCFGSVMIFSASFVYARSKYDDSLYFIRSQILWVLLGVAAMLVVMQFDYRLIKKYIALPAFCASYLLLAAVPIIGTSVRGAKRWITIGPMTIQPSEVMKFALILILALYISKFKDRMKTFKYGIFFPFCILGLVCVTTAIEKHMSGTIILFAIGVCVIFIGGANIRWLMGLFGVGAAGAGYIILFTNYTKARVDSWLHPELYTDSGAWQVLNSLYAIGSGGFLGVGLGNSREKYLYLPDPQNDFIYAIVCEELGFIGAITVIVLFALLVWRGFVIAMNAPDTFSSVVAFGIMAQVAIQTILNIAVVTASIPATGISLPFFSYGGSSLFMLMIEMGAMLAISRYSYQTRT